MHDKRDRVRKVSLLAAVMACSLLAGCRNYFLGYPYPWDYSKAKPKESEMVGTYEILKVRLPSKLSGFDKDARIILREDGSAEFDRVPEFGAFGERFVCSMSGTASWKLDDKVNVGWGWSVAFEDFHPASKPAAPECDPENAVIGGTLVLSRHAPYRLYNIVGDPDSDTGIEFQRSANQ